MKVWRRAGTMNIRGREPPALRLTPGKGPFESVPILSRMAEGAAHDQPTPKPKFGLLASEGDCNGV